MKISQSVRRILSLFFSLLALLLLLLPFLSSATSSGSCLFGKVARRTSFYSPQRNRDYFFAIIAAANENKLSARAPVFSASYVLQRK